MMIVVDNASKDGSTCELKSSLIMDPTIKGMFEYEREEAEKGGSPEKETALSKHASSEAIVLIRSGENRGYSAGNNIGIRYALARGAQAVLIINPDARLIDPCALGKMTDVMFSDKCIFAVGPNVTDRDGGTQGPLREPSFIEECIYPLMNVAMRGLGKKPKGYLEPINSSEPFEVAKIPGCCLLLRSSFLRNGGLLDERVFLYCEESILAERIRASGGRILFLPQVFVSHLHGKGTRVHWEHFFRSRRYFLTEYKKYGRIKAGIVLTVHRVVRILLGQSSGY